MNAILRIPLTKGYETIVDWDDLWAVEFKWCAMVNKSPNGQRVYAIRRKPGGGFLYLHREINNTPEGMDCDHRDGDTLNNRRGNLRRASRTLNNLNRKDTRGIHYAKRLGKWQAYITLHGKRRNLGTFATEVEAATARAKAYLELAEWLS